MSSEFGELLRHHRKLKGLSQAELRDKIEAWGPRYDKSAISKWETGLHAPPMEAVEILEDILLPSSNGLLLKAAGYRYAAEEAYQEADEELLEILRKMIRNLRNYLDSPAFLGSAHKPGNAIYGDGSATALLAKLKPIDKEKALQLLLRVKREHSELTDLEDWGNFPDERLSDDFLDRLESRERQGNI